LQAFCLEGAVGYLAKGLQLFGMANLMVGLYIGLTDERGCGRSSTCSASAASFFLGGSWMAGKTVSPVMRGFGFPPRDSLLGKRPGALKAADPAAAAPDQEYRRGVSLQQEGRMSEAIDALRACLRLDPTRSRAYDRLKEAYGHKQTIDQVVAELSNRTERDRSDFVSWNLLGVLYVKQGRWSDGMAALERAVRSEPRDVDAWTNLGWLLTELKQVGRAREAFGRALALNPGYGRAHAGMAGLHAEEGGDYDMAIDGYRLALSSEPDNPTYLYDMGWAYYRKGMTDRALEVLTRPRSSRPTIRRGERRSDGRGFA
jgi:tetratricopeptide (TPR) repeat protein